ncbi:MAG: alpha-L-rhamnosidase N-terminal domain-containing protein, partial [Caldilineaceae bacterium]
MAAQTLQVTDVRFEHRRDALGIGESHPRLSWITQTEIADWEQTAYEVALLAADGAPLGQTGRVESGQSVLVAWPFAALAAREARRVQVRVWGVDGSASGWSDEATVEAGLLAPEDWQAVMISPDWEEDTSIPLPAPFLRKEFALVKPVRKARLYVTALGVYHLEINSDVVSADVLAPGWTSYSHRLRYQTYDVTGLLTTGSNTIGAILAEGWYRGRLGYHGGRRNLYGDRLGLLAQLEVEYEDGERVIISSDPSWRATTGPILSAELYDGERVDARLALDGWSSPGFDDTGWSSVRVLEDDLGRLVVPDGPPMRRIEEIAPVAIFASPTGKTLV